MEYNVPKKCKLSHLVDGDTFDIETIPEGDVFRIRLKSIDAPELNQPAGWEAKHGLHKILEENNFELFIVPTHVGKNDRVVADAYFDETSAKVGHISQSINYRLCEEGLAWYALTDNKTNNKITTAQEIGRMANKGLWNRSISKPIHPSEWRIKNLKMGFLTKSDEYLRKITYVRNNEITMKDINIATPTISKKGIEDRKSGAFVPKKTHFSNELESFNANKEALSMLTSKKSTEQTQERIKDYKKKEQEKNEINSYKAKKPISKKSEKARLEKLKSIVENFNTMETKNNISKLNQEFESNSNKSFNRIREIEKDFSSIATEEKIKEMLNKRELLFKSITIKKEEIELPNTMNANKVDNSDIDKVFNDDIDFSNLFDNPDDGYNPKEVNFKKDPYTVKNELEEEIEIDIQDDFGSIQHIEDSENDLFNIDDLDLNLDLDLGLNNEYKETSENNSSFSDDNSYSSFNDDNSYSSFNDDNSYSSFNDDDLNNGNNYNDSNYESELQGYTENNQQQEKTKKSTIKRV